MQPGILRQDHLTENLDVRSEFTGVYETVLNPTNRLHAEFCEATLPTETGQG
ncbi:hypothetical protein G1H11_20550 [Phytoactinopolyspora alkaliphila]|uniref:Uncharacterized protein n=1 Tax=Phytoactinopolyspora alkaliphila TaxID=1783498 RepID=A0A6N9YRP2_9ACTN|nr:hypothetical protein [Phytoactinopolyspora alkaliphila]NED97693.1 hypothetical protein [Phytoactinopolyspora alkaliphila]